MRVCKDVEDWIEENVEQEVVKQETRCKSWPWPASWLCSLVTFIVKVIVTVVRKILRVVCEVVMFIVSMAAALLNLLRSIPLIGPALKALTRLISNAISYLVGLVDGLVRLAGVRITKHLRVHVLILCEGQMPLAKEANLQAILRDTERIFYERAQIRIHTTVHEPIRNPPENALRLGTEVDMVFDELWLKGTWHQLNTVKLFEDNLWALIAVGHPVVVYVVREVGYDASATGSGVTGASGGPLTDWVAVERDHVVDRVAMDPHGVIMKPLTPFPPVGVLPAGTLGVFNSAYDRYLIAHELCHALGLLGHGNTEPGDLMTSSPLTGEYLSPLQVGLIRSSAHVTYL